MPLPPVTPPDVAPADPAPEQAPGGPVENPIPSPNVPGVPGEPIPTPPNSPPGPIVA